jgi:two-component system, response regulator PdtaR
MGTIKSIRHKRRKQHRYLCLWELELGVLHFRDMTNHAPSRSFLIVDDEPIIRMDLAHILQEHGYESWEAANVNEALSMLTLSGNGFTGLITDINMPGSRNGIVFANHAKHVWPHLKIIVVSAGRRPLPGALPKDAKFLAKPFAEPLLSAALHA